METIQRRPDLAVIASFVIGLFIGLVVLGWGIWPVQWTDARPDALTAADQANYLRSVAELYSFDGDSGKVQQALSGWNGAGAACELANSSADQAEAARLTAIAGIASGGLDCATISAGGVQEGGSLVERLIPIIALLALLVILIAAILFVMNRRSAMMEEGGFDSGTFTDVPDSAPVVTGETDTPAVPLARFQTTYTRGHDTYDDSFSIENSGGDFLGECGVGISESIGADAPKNVTAFEVWLFDKNDIRTITKVVMSDHAFYDEALKAKLAPKGEPVLARENETIVLETASLIINAEIKELSYGTGTMPPQSYFERLTVELAAWAKEGDFEGPDIEGRVDELMNY